MLLLLFRKKLSSSFAGNSMCSDPFFQIREYWGFSDNFFLFLFPFFVCVAAAVSHKHHSIIRVGAGLIQFVCGSHSRVATGVTSSRILFSPFSRKFFDMSGVWSIRWPASALAGGAVCQPGAARHPLQGVNA